jgi:hypothetical protein
MALREAVSPCWLSGGGRMGSLEVIDERDG